MPPRESRWGFRLGVRPADGALLLQPYPIIPRVHHLSSEAQPALYPLWSREETQGPFGASVGAHQPKQEGALHMLSYTDVWNIVNRWHIKMRVTRLRNLALLVCGIIQSRSGCLSTIVRHWPHGSTRHTHRLKQFHHFLKNHEVRHEQWTRPWSMRSLRRLESPIKDPHPRTLGWGSAAFQMGRSLACPGPPQQQEPHGDGMGRRRPGKPLTAAGPCCAALPLRSRASSQ
jgi:phage-related protein